MCWFIELVGGYYIKYGKWVYENIFRVFWMLRSKNYKSYFIVGIVIRILLLLLLKINGYYYRCRELILIVF